jgi:rubrerythrin
VSTHLELAAVDVDGAVREAEIAVAGDTRADFFRKAAIGGGAAITGGAFLGMLPELADAKPSKKQDIAILNYALTLEYLETAFYEQARDSGVFTGATQGIATVIAQHEREHVNALIATIKSLNTDARSFLPTALVLENTGTRAYHGQVTRLKSKALLSAAAKIATVEARHAAAVAVLVGDNPFADKTSGSITPYGSFDKQSSMKKILEEVGATGFITG